MAHPWQKKHDALLEEFNRYRRTHTLTVEELDKILQERLKSLKAKLHKAWEEVDQLKEKINDLS